MNSSGTSPIVRLETPDGVQYVVDCATKLTVRGRLAGAFAWDRAAQQLRSLVGDASTALATLPLVLPASWLVNNRTTSAVFRRWLEPPFDTHWATLLDHLLPLTVVDWPQVATDPRDEIASAVQSLCIDGQGVAALSKVLALLCPDLVPLMDDAALAMLCGSVPMPTRADTPSAGPEHFAPMLDAFADSVSANAGALELLAADATPIGLSPAQALDRLLWFESWGQRLFGQGRNSWWVFAQGSARVVLRCDGSPTSTAQPHVAVPVDTIEDTTLRSRVAAVFDGLPLD